MSNSGLLAWDVVRLVGLSRKFPVRVVTLVAIRELDQAVFGKDEPPIWRLRRCAFRLVEAAELAYPIICVADGTVVDGMYGVTKALVQCRETPRRLRYVSRFGSR